MARDDQIIRPEHIQYYEQLPEEYNRAKIGHGIDLAISQRETADYTAIVTAYTYYLDNKKAKIFIQPDPVNSRMDFHITMGKVMEITLKDLWHTFFVEDVGYQKAAIQEMERYGLDVQAMKPLGDKSARLQVADNYIKNGTVLFPRKGCEDLINQLINFGV